MNETVRKLVDIVFRDTEQTEEVQVLYEQVLLDCQERYSDLVKDGMDEDEAIAAVVESLKGMDEILKDYPVREQPEEQMESSGEQAPEKFALNLPFCASAGTGKQFRWRKCRRNRSTACPGFFPS